MDARIGILTVSDTRDAQTDVSGPLAVQCLRNFGYREFETSICKDVLEEIQAEILRLCQNNRAVFTTGGTGFAHRDVTPEATAPLLDRRADNLCELMRIKGLEHTAFSHLSRGIAGIRGDVLIVNLPGAPNAVRQSFVALAPLLRPILEALAEPMESAPPEEPVAAAPVEEPQPVEETEPSSTEWWK